MCHIKHPIVELQSITHAYMSGIKACAPWSGWKSIRLHADLGHAKISFGASHLLSRPVISIISVLYLKTMLYDIMNKREYKTCIVVLLLKNICIITISDTILHTLVRVMLCIITINKRWRTNADAFPLMMLQLPTETVDGSYNFENIFSFSHTRINIDPHNKLDSNAGYILANFPFYLPIHVTNLRHYGGRFCTSIWFWFSNLLSRHIVPHAGSFNKCSSLCSQTMWPHHYVLSVNLVNLRKYTSELINSSSEHDYYRTSVILYMHIIHEASNDKTYSICEWFQFSFRIWKWSGRTSPTRFRIIKRLWIQIRYNYYAFIMCFDIIDNFIIDQPFISVQGSSHMWRTLMNWFTYLKENVDKIYRQ